MKRFDALTKYIPILEGHEAGNWVIDRENDGTSEHPIRMPYVDYSLPVIQFEDAVYKAVDKYPDMKLSSYNSILQKFGIEWGSESMQEADVSEVDALCVIALLVGVIRAERFCDGALLRFFKNGCILKWLRRLEELDE